MMKEARTLFTEEGHTYYLKAHYGFHKIGDQKPYFSVTGELYRALKLDDGKVSIGKSESFGMLHDDIEKHMPELKDLLKWHLCADQEGPMHYIANAQYWWEHVRGISKWELNSYDPDPIEAFKSTVVFGVVDGDTLPEGDDVSSWCAARFADLMQAFQRDMVRFGVKVSDAEVSR